MKQEHMRTGTNESRKDGTIIIGEVTKMKKIMYLLFVLVMSISLSGCQKPDFYTEDFTAMSGNTSDNIWQGGLLASTDEYLYIPLEDTVMEIRKETGKPVVLENIAAEFGYINVINGYLYYNAFHSEDNKRGLVVQSLDGRFFRQISKTSYFPFIVFEDWIYATNLRGGNLYKINSKDSQTILLAEGPVEEFTLYDNGIFYNDGNDLYSIDLDGENKQKLLSDIQIKSLTYNKEDNMLIFVNSSEGNKICSYHLNTNDLSYIKNEEYSFVQVFGKDKIITLNSAGLLQSFSLPDGHAGIEIPGVTHFQIFDQTLYYFDESNSVYCLTDKNRKPKVVYSPESETENK